MSFWYDDIERLNSIEKEIILILGDDLKLFPKTYNAPVLKDKKQLYEQYFSEKISKNKFEEIIRRFFIKHKLIEFRRNSPGRDFSEEEILNV